MVVLNKIFLPFEKLVRHQLYICFENITISLTPITAPGEARTRDLGIS